MKESGAMSFEGFLPKNSIVMGKRGSIPLSGEIRSEGNSAAELVFIGFESGPKSSRPFSAKASELLDKMVAAMGLKPENVFVASILPGSDESIWEHATLASLQPRVWVALGEGIAQWIYGDGFDFSSDRGEFVEFRDSQCIVSFHPEQLLTQPELKREAWADLQKVAKELGITIPSKK